MAIFSSPIADPNNWTLSILEEGVPIPPGLRYEGYTFRGISARSNVERNVLAPTDGIVTVRNGVLQLEINPFPFRRIAQKFPWGLPTFYFFFDSHIEGGLSTGDVVTAGELIHTTTGVTIVIATQDRSVLDPALLAAQIQRTIGDGGGAEGDWRAFADAVTSQTASGDDAPVLILDHTGRPLGKGQRIEVVFGPAVGTQFEFELYDSDGGDLQKAIKRQPGSYPFADLWGRDRAQLPDPVRVRPKVPNQARDEFDFQLVRLEDGHTAVGEVDITPARRHVALTNLHDWFASQYATLEGEGGPRLARYHRGSKVTAFVNGFEFFDDFFAELNSAAQAPGSGFHLAGWSMFSEVNFVKVPDGASPDFPTSLKAAADFIGQRGGQCRFLPAKFVALEPGAAATAQVVPLYLQVVALYLLTATSLPSEHTALLITDPTGASPLIGPLLIALALWKDGGKLASIFLPADEPWEPNKDTVSQLDGLTNSQGRFSECRFSLYPAHRSDNPLAPGLDEFPFNALFTTIQQFGVYHQKLAIVKSGPRFVGYCGGIDLNPDRLDDENHLGKHTPNKMPFHDVHVRVEGPAVRDIALTFHERWLRDGGGTQPAFDPPTTGDLGTPRQDIIQVARTYFMPSGSYSEGGPTPQQRTLEFAPTGDRTLLDTMLNALRQAREFIYIEDQYFTPPWEYRNLLAGKVARGEIRKLIVVIPALTDQPFGEIIRSGFINELQAADNNRGIVHIGVPRRRYTVPETKLRASSGRLILAEELTDGATEIAFGPASRIPPVPFWLAVEGELIWVYDELPESLSPTQVPETKRFTVARGEDTRILGNETGTTRRDHSAGAAATVVDLTNIYVHAKLMIVDDVFLGVGSANLNRRGFYHDGEANVYCLPEAMKWSLNNPIAALRRRLWAEMLDLPLGMIDPLLRDPVAASKLFGRSYFQGNRFVPPYAMPEIPMFAVRGSDSAVMTLLQAAGMIIAAEHYDDFFDAVVDPTSNLDPAKDPLYPYKVWTE